MKKPTLRKKVKKQRRKMKAGGGKRKGSAYERVVCKALSKWLTKGKRDDVLWRSSLSGGRATVHAKKGKKMAHVAGDICAVHPDGEAFSRVYFVECKNYRDLGIVQLVTKGSGTLQKFWEKAKAQARQHSKDPMLIFKQGKCPTMLGVRWNCQARFGLHYRVEFTKQDLVLFDFAEFLEHATPPH